ncbi:MAG: GGDEF domain-containing protein [Bacillota bacterium]|nr:GGDEF domain-containing protein [Bacillota bacterium]
MSEHAKDPESAARSNLSFSGRIEAAIIKAGNKMADLPEQGAGLSVDRRSRLLAWTILLLLFTMLLIIVLTLLSEHDAPDRRLLYVAVPFFYGVLLIFGFSFNRKRLIHVASLFTVLGGIAAIWSSILLDQQIYQGPDIIPLFYIALTILLASFLLSSWETCLLAALQIGGLILLLQQRNAWSELNWQSLFAFMVITTILSLSISHIIQADLRQIEEQNRHLLANEANLKDLATRDSLTHLYNRHYLEETLPREIKRVARRNSTLGIIMIDVDYFKEINDQHGHAVGDEFLKAVGSILADKVRDSDIACRYGGDEYVLIMPDASLQSTKERAEAIRESTREWQIRIGDITITNPSLSCGVATYPEHGLTGAVVLKAADDALYQAKRNGRNRTEIAVTDRDSQSA